MKSKAQITNYQFDIHLTGTCPASPALQDGAKGHNTKVNYLAGKPRPLGRGASNLNFDI
jgi:hypothetical protein